jgi:hypothetical protein
MQKLAGVVRQLKIERTRASKEVERLDAALAALNGSFGNSYGKRAGIRPRLSAAARARIAAAQRARWAKLRGSVGQVKSATGKRPRRALSAAARKKIAAAQRARWARIKAGKKAA